MAEFAGRVGLMQRVLPVYRAPFFDRLAAECAGGLSVFAGKARPGEAIKETEELKEAVYAPADNKDWLGGVAYLLTQRRLMTWLREWIPDALIAEANPRYLSTPNAISWMHSRGRPVIGWGLGAPEPAGGLASLRSARRKSFLAQFDALIAYSQRGADEYSKLGISTEKIHVAPNAVASRPAGKAPARREKQTGRAKLLYVGRLQERKNIDILLRACAALPEQLQPQLIIVGEGDIRAELEELAAGLYPSADFRGALFGADLEKIFQQADLFVLPGTGGLAVQEAMSHALPVIVAEGDGTQEDLVTEANGWLVKPGDVDELAARLKSALSDIARLRRMGAESYRLVQEEFNIENMVAVFIKALKQVSG